MKRIVPILLGATLLAGLCVRVWGINFGLPYMYHPDEPRRVIIVQNMFKEGDLNPHFFNYPSLFLYINALAYIPYFLFGKLIGVFSTRHDILSPVSLAMGVTYSPMPTTILLGRMITVVFGMGTIALTFFIGRQLTSKPEVGLLASLFVAVSPSNVTHSRFITPDTFVVFFATASFLATVLVYQQGKTRHYAVAGICAGLTISSKYNAAWILLPLVLAHFLRLGRAGFTDKNLVLALLLCGLSFVATTPFALLDSRKFITDVQFAARHYSTGHAGMEGNPFGWYVRYMGQTAGAIYILAALECLRGILSRDRRTILLSSFPVVYLAFISSFAVRNDRTFLPLTPFLFLLASLFLVRLINKANAFHCKTFQVPALFAIALLLVGSLIQPISRTIANAVRLTTVDSRETARVWVNENLPSGTKVAIESYSPFVDPSRFSVQGFGRIIDHKPEWYIEQGFDYLVMSQGMYGRYFQEPERYETEVGRYEEFFTRFHPVKVFTDGGYEIRVYQVR